MREENYFKLPVIEGLITWPISIYHFNTDSYLSDLYDLDVIYNYVKTLFPMPSFQISFSAVALELCRIAHVFLSIADLTVKRKTP